jgi:hypothetical protein
LISCVHTAKHDDTSLPIAFASIGATSLSMVTFNARISSFCKRYRYCQNCTATFVITGVRCVRCAVRAPHLQSTSWVACQLWVVRLNQKREVRSPNSTPSTARAFQLVFVLCLSHFGLNGGFARASASLRCFSHIGSCRGLRDANSHLYHAVRYAWSESPCCGGNIDTGIMPCPVNSCPISTVNSTLPVNDSLQPVSVSMTHSKPSLFRCLIPSPLFR